MDEKTELDPAMETYYQDGREEARLKTSCRLEFLRTQELLARFLPPPPARVLDVGGAAGIHALPLIERGYDVELVDPVELHVEQARAAGVSRASIGDARNLEFDDESIDAVLLLGPLYHLVNRDDRVRAISEARRVLRVSGVVCAAAISRFASLCDGLLRGFITDPEFESIVERDVQDGQHLNPTNHPGWFTTAYFHRPEDLEAEIRDGGFNLEAVIAIEGIGGLLTDIDRWLDDPQLSEVLMRSIRRVEFEPALLGASSHILAAGRKTDREPET